MSLPRKATYPLLLIVTLVEVLYCFSPSLGRAVMKQISVFLSTNKWMIRRRYTFVSWVLLYMQKRSTLLVVSVADELILAGSFWSEFWAFVTSLTGYYSLLRYITWERYSRCVFPHKGDCSLYAYGSINTGEQRHTIQTNNFDLTKSVVNCLGL